MLAVSRHREAHSAAACLPGAPTASRAALRLVVRPRPSLPRRAFESSRSHPRVPRLRPRYDDFRGAICLVRVVDGVLEQGTKLQLSHSMKRLEAQEVGIMTPAPHQVSRLTAGQVGYLIAGIKSAVDARVGDTFVDARHPDLPPLPGFQPAKPMVRGLRRGRGRGRKEGRGTPAGLASSLVADQGA